MISFGGKKYELFFSNDITPFQALTFAGEDFFNEFERLCGSRYRLLSIIRYGEQEKYGRVDDDIKLARAFHSKLNNDQWIKSVLGAYEKSRTEFKAYLQKINRLKFKKISDDELSAALLSGFMPGVSIAAISNMLHMFSSLLENEFFQRLEKYSDNAKEITENRIFYTQPLRQSRFSKILKAKLKNAFPLSKQEKNFSTILRVGAYVKGDGSALFAERMVIWHKLLGEIAKRFKISDANSILYFFPAEIKQIFKTGRVPFDLLDRRKRLTILFYQTRKLEIYEGEAGERFLKKGKLQKILLVNNGILMGQPASPGKVEGKAVVAHGLNEALSLVKKGDILVTGYTSARYVPAMKKAAAIITETGGITAHAAVVSRELGVPCVIAVKDVTKVIKTGDLVEVDADKGVVRILKRK
ncbi:MAG: PEP-utilizing enzyme [Patescibacteria group bacterium]|nr:PEP-utilizing enzyme [Patescibacteria group bacterium]